MIRHAKLFAAGLLLGFLSQTSLRGQSILVKPSTLPLHILVDLPPGSYDHAAPYALVDASNSDMRLPAQVIRKIRADGTASLSEYQLIATVPGTDQAGAERSFRLDKEADDPREQVYQFARTDRSVQLSETNARSQESHPIWQYNYGTVVDESVSKNDSRRSRSCYVHPVWGIHGEILTDDFPKDHHHHHGIFWTWPYVKAGDKTCDLWMSADIRQRFVKWLATDAGPVAAVMGVENGWFADQQQVATERIWLITYRSELNCRATDIAVVVEAGEKPVTLQGRQKKSYGGLTLRFDVLPRKDATVRVPGKALGFGAPARSGSPDLLNTPLPWADLTTQIPGTRQRSGAAVFIHPDHPNYPPTWLTRTYGALCVGWPGVESYTIKPGTSIQLNYRIWIHGDEPDLDQLDSQYRAYLASRQAASQ